MYDGTTRNTCIGIDWSKFDKRLLHQLIRIVHRIWRQYFDFSQYEETSHWRGKTNPQRLENLWEWMCSAITGTPIELPDGTIWTWNWNGFGSGFQQTQLMDSFANAIMIYTCLTALGVNVNSRSFWARFQGDDSLIFFCEQMFRIYGNHFLEMMAEVALKYFNAKLQLKKSMIQSRVTGMSVLSYPNLMGIAYREEFDLLSHLYFPERPQDYPRLAASALGLAQAALGCSTRFHNLCEDIWNSIVKKRGIQPNYSALKWMVRIGLYESIDELAKAEFPSQISLMLKAWVVEKRSESLKEQQWPTKPDSKGGFYFIDSL